MEWLEILGRIEAGESGRTEFKRGLGDLSAVGRVMCAFANAEGGVIVLGVADPGEIVGVTEHAEHVHPPSMNRWTAAVALPPGPPSLVIQSLS